MRTITSTSGEEETVAVRRSESADAQGIDSLIGPSSVAVFGRINVIHLLEKANLAVTLTNERDDIVAQASFFDHPVGNLVDQSQWEPFLHKHFSAETCTPLNTLFLHLFVAREDFARASIKEIMRAVFNAVTELEFICLVSPHVGFLEPALEQMFQPMQRQTDQGPQCLALICHRQDHFPRLNVRPARVEDHDDIMRIFADQIKVSLSDRPYFLAEIIETQNEENYTAVCESDGVAVGFVSVTSDVDLKRLQQSFDLSEFNGLFKKTKQDKSSAESESREEEEELTITSNSDSQQQGETQSNAFCIQLFVIDKKFETRSVDFIPYLFNLFPDLDFCIITIPTLSPEFLLLQSFLRVPPLPSSFPPRELYVFHRSGLRSVKVRPAVALDRQSVCKLVKSLKLKESLLEDLDCFYETRRDMKGVPLQAFVAQVNSQVVGIVIIRDEQDMEFTRAHYNIENFIYFSHHRYEEHAHITHFVLKPSYQHFTKHLFKEILRLAHKSCFYHRIYPSHHSPENSCVRHLDFVLNCAVPVRPRRQIIYPLEELGINAPSTQITKEQAPFSLSLISRKLTMEPKVTVNARIVVVGASDTGLSFLEVLCFCPHLMFNNLTLISTHSLPGDLNHDDVGFLSTSHAYSSTDLAKLPLHSSITVVTGKMVGINRRSQYVLVSGGGKVPYDHLILCTGLQYQVPRPSGVYDREAAPHSQPPPGPQSAQGRYSGTVPSNLFTLNDLHDARQARGWIRDNFLELEDNAIVYGNSIDVYTSVETLLSLGISGHRIHVVCPPREPGSACFRDPVVEKAVAESMKTARVHVHYNCVLAQFNNGEHPDPLTSVSFNTDTEPLQLQCGVFINLSNKGVDYDAFQSINNSFLVFDSRLVINSSFYTSDPVICGAGPLTKFSRCYHADEWSHGNFNSKEVGQNLAVTLLPLFDPTMEPTAEDSPAEMDRLVPLYKQAKIQGGKLPGGFNYLHVTKPTATIKGSRGVKPIQDNGIATGGAETGNYFCLHLDSLDVVETLTCLSLQPLPFSNYLCLFAKHQQLLGQLSNRYYQGLIRDLYSFFRQSWCFAIYHDRFSDFELELQQITYSTGPLQSEQQPDTEEEEAIVVPKHRFTEAENRAALRNSAVKYLTYNRNLLPMFAIPGQM